MSTKKSAATTPNKKASTGSELVAVGIFTVIILVIHTLCNIIGVLGPEVQPFGGVVAVIINGIPFMLFLRRIHHFGLITSMTLLISVVLVLMGHHPIGIPLALACGLIADIIVTSGTFAHRNRNILGYAFFALYPMSGIFPLLFMRHQLIEMYTKQADAHWAQSFSDFFSAPMVFGIGAGCFIAGLIGGWLGQRLVRTYFSRAGL
ncbi:MptD family putative ECF transporter S component [Corynebacterium kroppenstedtii]|uniref:MptD family putative ECF transporter S component n=1 Tax=Corynebacterium sp. PCR 32 TaxID=3351342 RepID=UPI0030A622A5